MPALYSDLVSNFLQTEDDAIVGTLSSVANRAQTTITAEQLQSWRDQLRILRHAVAAPESAGWHVLLEYPIPRRGKRIDAVILAESLILVLEFKCGARSYEREARIQVEDYCLDLRDFHAASRARTLVPILVASHASQPQVTFGDPVDWVAPTVLTNANSLKATLQTVVRRYSSPDAAPLDPDRWNHSEYSPTPTIIEAARVLYEGQNVREITRCHAGAKNLTKTSTAVMEAIERARASRQKVICFITGVPGSGKTLAGLNIVHSKELHEGSLGVFLSGNGPLVKVLSEALARDHTRRTGKSVEDSRREVSTFIQNVHRFIDTYFESPQAPQDRVIVFDEAQRAWDREQSLRKFRRDRSEPEVILEIMDRHEEWAVIVALIGDGQEINTGEAGLREWGRALESRFAHWQVHVSPQMLEGRLFEDGLFSQARLGAPVVRTNPNLHLDVSLRSYRAQAVSDFVHSLLLKDVDNARSRLAQCSGFAIVRTRSLESAKRWLRERQRGSRRIGLAASSGGRRLRAYGLDVRLELDVENWFLNPSSDVRSSYYLETPATEFAVQGLELDWTGVCWDVDLVPDSNGWRVRAFRGTTWQTVRDPVKQQYVLNKYRVLLTRAREGMVIWVPTGDEADETRPPRWYDSIWAFLRSCGIPEL